jgi:hypothetical protein
MKSGANKKDVQAIKRLALRGVAPKEISSALAIDLACVEDFVNSFDIPEVKEPPAEKTKEPKKAATEDNVGVKAGSLTKGPPPK